MKRSYLLIKYIKIEIKNNLFIPKKSLGQNFLLDKNIISKIINLINKFENKTILEIDTGKGALTDELLKKEPKKLILIEKDKVLFDELSIKYQKFKNVKIYNADALNFDYSKINTIDGIIANLPYNISVNLIIQWMKNIHHYKEIIVMIQKEVAEKFRYKNIKKRNRLNTFAEITSYIELKFDVSKNVFYPKPKVKSSVLKILPKNKYNVNLDKFENFTRDIFSNKRKKLSNVLKKIQIKNIENIYKLNVIDKRAEDLNLDQLIKIFKEY